MLVIVLECLNLVMTKTGGGNQTFVHKVYKGLMSEIFKKEKWTNKFKNLKEIVMNLQAETYASGFLTPEYVCLCVCRGNPIQLYYL